MALEWEPIGLFPQNYAHEVQRRAKVHGGWLVRTNGVEEGTVAMAFVTDKEHTWKI